MMLLFAIALLSTLSYADECTANDNAVINPDGSFDECCTGSKKCYDVGFEQGTFKCVDCNTGCLDDQMFSVRECVGAEEEFADQFPTGASPTEHGGNAFVELFSADFENDSGCKNQEELWYNVGSNPDNRKKTFYDTLKLSKLMFEWTAPQSEGGGKQFGVINVPESARNGEPMTTVEWLREVFGLESSQLFPKKSNNPKWDPLRLPGYHQALEWIRKTEKFTGEKLKIGVGDGQDNIDADWQLFAFTDETHANYKETNIFNLGGEEYCSNLQKGSMVLYGQEATDKNRLRSLSFDLVLKSPEWTQALTCEELTDAVVRAYAARYTDIVQHEINAAPGEGCQNLDKRNEKPGRPADEYNPSTLSVGTWKMKISITKEAEELELLQQSLQNTDFPIEYVAGFVAYKRSPGDVGDFEKVSLDGFEIGPPINPCGSMPCFGSGEWASICQYTPTNLVTRYTCTCANDAYTYIQGFGCSNHKDGYWVARGGGRSGYCQEESDCSPHVASVQEGHYVTCCTDTPDKAWEKVDGNDMCKDTYYAMDKWGQGCLGKVNWWVADRFCKDNGARLCTFEEVSEGCTFSTEDTCQYNNRMIWTSLGSNEKIDHVAAWNALSDSMLTPKAGDYFYITPRDPEVLTKGTCEENGTKGCHTMAVGPSEEYEYSCCSDNPVQYWKESCDKNVYFAENIFEKTNGCRPKANWETANRFCRKNGGYICTLSQLQSGCGYFEGFCESQNTHNVWTGTRAGDSAKPSPAPTYSTERVQGQSHHKIVKGSGPRVGQCRQKDDVKCNTRSGANVDLYSVRCCSDQPRGWWTDRQCPKEVWSSSRQWFTVKDECLKLNWYQAKDHCLAQGGRLCTVDELERGCAAGTGCAYDDYMNWASDVGLALECIPAKDTCHCEYNQIKQVVNNYNGGCDNCICLENPHIPNSHTIAKGSTGDTCENPNGCASRPALNSDVYAIRCCDDREPPGQFPRWQQRCVGVWSETDAIGGNCESASWENGAKFCHENGHRLCTLWEVEHDCAAGTGCGFDNKMVWTADDPITVTDAPTQAEVKAKEMDGDACDVREKVLETFNHGFTSNWIGCADVPNSYCEEVRSIGDSDQQCEIVAGTCMGFAGR